MGDVGLVLVLCGGFAATIGGLVRLTVHTRRRGRGSAAVRAAVAAHDEMWRPTAHQSHFEIVVQDRRRVQLASPDDQSRRRRG